MTLLSSGLIDSLRLHFDALSQKNAVVGVSGGIDSAVTLALAVESLGKENVIGVLMPYQVGKFSSMVNRDDAQALCDDLGVQSKAIYLDSIVDEYIDSLDESMSIMTTGNMLARIRMTILFTFANQYNALVLGTCNKTEVLLGYETKFGDGACDINVLGNFWKHEVYSMAKELSLPEKFITKTPSAELFEGQSDEEEMGFAYTQAEKILSLWDEGRGQIYFEGEEKVIFEKIKKMYEVSAHKRIFPPTLDR